MPHATCHVHVHVRCRSLKFVFKMEEQIYTEECIRGMKIMYQDNQPCIELVEKPPYCTPSNTRPIPKRSPSPTPSIALGQ